MAAGALMAMHVVGVNIRDPNETLSAELLPFPAWQWPGVVAGDGGGRADGDACGGSQHPAAADGGRRLRRRRRARSAVRHGQHGVGCQPGKKQEVCTQIKQKQQSKIQIGKSELALCSQCSPSCPTWCPAPQSGE